VEANLLKNPDPNRNFRLGGGGDIVPNYKLPKEQQVVDFSQ